MKWSCGALPAMPPTMQAGAPHFNVASSTPPLQLVFPLRIGRQRRSQNSPMLETINAITVQVIGEVRNSHTRVSHFRQKILDLRQARARL